MNVTRSQRKRRRMRKLLFTSNDERQPKRIHECFPDTVDPRGPKGK